MPLWKRATFWWADLWPSDCVACIYLRFVILGFGIGMIWVAVLLYGLWRAW